MKRDQASPSAIDLRGLRVLVVEDDYFIADEICAVLRLCNAEVIGPASDVERALQFFRTHFVDCAVLDVNLHGALSFAFAYELQQRAVPIVFATGYDLSMLPESLAESTWLEKPIDLEALLLAVRTSVQRPDSFRPH